MDNALPAYPLLQSCSPGRRELGTLLQEAALLGGLSHPHVVRLHGACLSPGRVCLVTELCHGGDLYHALRSRPDSMRCGPRGGGKKGASRLVGGGGEKGGGELCRAGGLGA